jgi:uncharacterized membrane protein
MGPDWFVLIGVVVIVVGFLLKLDVIAVVVIAALTTTLIAGKSFGDFLDLIGKAFVDNRAVSLFLLTLPMIALSERYGLKEQAITLISKLHKLTPGRFLTLYTVIRQLTGIFGIRISGMVQFVRPIVHPMTSAASRARGATSSEADEKVKAESALAENVGNFFGQNGFVAASGVLLIVGTLTEAGYDVTPEKIVAASLPVIVIATVVVAIHFWRLDRPLAAGGQPAAGPPPPPTSGPTAGSTDAPGTAAPTETTGQTGE